MAQTEGAAAIIQARVNSSRLPGKVLADICGHPALWHTVQRLKRSKLLTQIWVATSDQAADEPIAQFCEANQIPCFRGSENDVLDRFYRAARKTQATQIVRITADCTLIDPEVVDFVISEFQKRDVDYASNTLLPSYPDGLDTEIFSFAALERAWNETQKPTDREHVTPYLRNSGAFRTHNAMNPSGAHTARFRWVLDQPEDLEFIRHVYQRLWSKDRPAFGMQEILGLLSQESSLQSSTPPPHSTDIGTNAHALRNSRNEGYYVSITRNPPVPPKSRSLEKSLALKKRAESLIPSGTQTFSKGHTQFVQGVAPVYLERAKGSHVWDVDGNEYIDFPMALGPIILGHCYPAVDAAVKAQIDQCVALSLPHPLEIQLAALLKEIIPCAEMSRFGKNGSDVTSGAVRAARAFTGRDGVACSGYHGWQDWYIGTTTRNRGVPAEVARLTHVFDYNRIESLEKIFKENPGQIACVILEPMGIVHPKDDFLNKVKNLAHREGALLIFDEIVTGFRFAMGGAQELFGVVPDLACFGKAMGNGFPIAAVCGKAEIMQIFDEIFFSFTCGGEVASLAAAYATLTELREKRALVRIWELGEQLQTGYRALANHYELSKITDCVGTPPRNLVTFKDQNGVDSLLYKSYFQQECLKRGLLFTGNHNLCYSHSDGDIDYTLNVYRTVLELLAQGIRSQQIENLLEGPMIQPVFRRA